MRACSIMIHAVLASLATASGCEAVPRLSSEISAAVPDETTSAAFPPRPPPPPPPPLPELRPVPPPSSIRAAFEASNDRPEPWTATAYDLVPTKARDRRPRFATRAIKRAMPLSSTRADYLAHGLSTDAGYLNVRYACCPVGNEESALGLRLARGPVVLDFVIQCGEIALGAPPDLDRPERQGTLSHEMVFFLESLHKGPCS